MSNASACPKCGALLSDDAPAGLCPKCLVQAGFESEHAPSAGGSDPAVQPTLKSPAHSGGGFEPPSAQELALLFPQLEILELLGKGGMGAVYKARQRGLDRLVAVKILPPEIGQDAAFAERFTREARALARLNHPHIVAVYDFGQANGLFYIVMEFVDGANLRQTIQAGNIKPEQALAIVPQICEALQFAHDEGIVHRDIKPENILIDRKGRVKIADFGLAKLVGQDSREHLLTGTHQVMGTLRYMAPEQMQGSREVDHRADIYSLGVVFYELLTGELPMGRFAPPSKKVQVDVRLDEVVLRALEQDPQQRYQHASQIKSDVESVASTPQIAAVPQTVGPAVAEFGDRVLLDEIERAPRAQQSLFAFSGTIVLMGGFVVCTGGNLSLLPLEIGMGAVGVALIILACRIRQQWEVDYLGHVVRFENSLHTAERLLIDGKIVATGGLGLRSEMSSCIRNGPGAGDRIVAVANAGLLSYGCRIVVQSAKPEAAAPPESAATSQRDELLLDEIDLSARRLQHFALIGGLSLMALGIVLVPLSPPFIPLAVVMGAASIGLLILAARTKQQWEVDYCGHTVRFENSVVTSGCLLIDGKIVASGGIGLRTELSGRIPRGPGAGDRIVAKTRAGFLSFGCQLFVQRQASATAQQNEIRPGAATEARAEVASSTTVPQAAPPSKRPKLVPVLATINLLGGAVLMMLSATEEMATFSEPVPRIWQVWAQVDAVVTFAMSAGLFAAGIGLYLWKPWARKLTVWICILALASLVLDAPYLVRAALPDLNSEIQKSMIAEGVSPDAVEFASFSTLVVLCGGLLLVGLVWLIGQLIYFTRPRVVAAFEPQSQVGSQALPASYTSTLRRRISVAAGIAVGLVCFAALFVFDWVGNPFGPPARKPLDLNGVWDTSHPWPVEFSHWPITPGTKSVPIKGKYEATGSFQGSGQIDATLDVATRTIEGDFTSGVSSGRVRLVVSPDGNSIAGTYGWRNAATGDEQVTAHRWDMRRRMTANVTGGSTSPNRTAISTIEAPADSATPAESSAGWIMGRNGPVLTESFARVILKLQPEKIEAVNAALQESHREFLALETQHSERRTNDAGHVITTVTPFPGPLAKLENRLWFELDSILDAEQQAIARLNLKLRAEPIRPNMPLSEIVSRGFFGWEDDSGEIEVWRVGKWFHWSVKARGYHDASNGPQLPAQYRRFWKEATTDNARIEGTWKYVSSIRDGQITDPVELQNWKVTFGREEYTEQPGDRFEKGTYKLDPLKSPKTIDCLITEGEYKGLPVAGIYDWDGDTLKICWARWGNLEHPQEFSATPGSQRALVVLKRESAADDSHD